ncbi:hypothetical protein Kpol_529p19 [Vanderwaltozyma polyspora DSM 70294]|uniref:NADH-cytochrome b5 reductase 2-B n=1 Tax=Vanderwaltozyma polyspora (strain ATCC 22028 / DSM 70294 / BCRC 21397 / CBS 2163 / NBRC 10782 / NRRL Y-8283 / UCD 57-17) TaxID=436907 RepID=MCR1B_VANPO|nr:uncharacterized protein Kpol_529p19 [Vanderwaltozyma polyspora DSM 70294]A7TM72.1 RecName: Full=NADH-cytochrome b5 reductase 2-B; AltName: Full=Mitochondrial cytochrome b reductase B [Vanderwaltozyma polyspora DSM 70294]EDO16639.1 hypothetical protein Kpol_529p19 [Vanderwaltozyma polyspora DSM 70294]
MISSFTSLGSRPLLLSSGIAVTAAAAVYFSTGSRLANEALHNKTFKGFKGPASTWVDLPLVKFEDLSHDTRKFTFKLPNDDDVSGISPLSFLLARPHGTWSLRGIRPYTPVSLPETQGVIEFVIKHVPNGGMSSHMFSLKPNDTVSFTGPIVKYEWKQNKFDSVTLLGAGSGITPLYQLMGSILSNPEDKTKINLFYANKTSDDILLKKELDEFQQKFSDRVKIHYYLSQPKTKDIASTGAKKGFIAKEDIESLAPASNENTHVFVCGPEPFVKAYAGQQGPLFFQGSFGGILKELGYTKSQVFKV